MIYDKINIRVFCTFSGNLFLTIFKISVFQPRKSHLSCYKLWSNLIIIWLVITNFMLDMVLTMENRYAETSIK